MAIGSGQRFVARLPWSECRFGIGAVGHGGSVIETKTVQ
jgi:hypothetical protein